MKKISKLPERYKKEQNLTSTSYFYLEAVKKAHAEQKKRSGKYQVPQTAQDPNSSNAHVTKCKMPHSQEGLPVHQLAEPSSLEQLDAVKPEYPVQPDKKPRASNQEQTAKTKSASIHNSCVLPISKEDTDYRSVKIPIQKLDNSLPDSLHKHTIDKNVISIVKPYTLEAELFKVLRGKILFPISGKPPKSIMIASAVPGEGKSFIASNLAVNLAQNIAEHVLLVDCDLRRPCLHKLFGFDKVKGLSEHLSSGYRLSNLLLKTVVDKLTLLPAGQPPHNPSEILSSANMANLICELKSRYDDRYLIFDTPPGMLAPETSALTKCVDGIIVVIKCGDTSFKLIEKMINDMGNEKILGAVLNQTDTLSSGYYSGYIKYSRYYRPPTEQKRL